MTPAILAAAAVLAIAAGGSLPTDERITPIEKFTVGDLFAITAPKAPVSLEEIKPSRWTSDSSHRAGVAVLADGNLVQYLTLDCVRRAWRIELIGNAAKDGDGYTVSNLHQPESIVDMTFTPIVGPLVEAVEAFACKGALVAAKPDSSTKGRQEI